MIPMIQADHVLVIDAPKPMAMDLVANAGCSSELAVDKLAIAGLDYVANMVKCEGVDVVERLLIRFDQNESGVIHRFGPGQYIRELNMPAGTVALGHSQRHEHMNVMLSGRATMINDDGSTFDIVAPMMFVGNPGRKAGVIWEDMVWLNIYPTEETDVETLEGLFIHKTQESIDDIRAARMNKDCTIDIADYCAVLDEFGFSEDQAQFMMHFDNMTKLPYGAYKIKVSDSPINGKGLFATAPIVEGEIICPALIGDKRTIGGRYTNHSATPNATFEQLPNGDLSLVALRHISGCRGGFDGEEITIDYRVSLRMAFKENERE